jgi:flagellar L-ring protein precursor FlgH
MQINLTLLIIPGAFFLIFANPAQARKKASGPLPSATDRMIEAATNRPVDAAPAAPGSLFRPSAPLGDVYQDLRASRVDDIVTILVSDRASALSSGKTATQRQSSATGGIKTVLGKSVAPLGDLATISGNQDLKSQGATGRESALTTTLTARVTQVLPNGAMVIEAEKNIVVNSERQHVKVRGVVRYYDVSTANTVSSDRIANLEVAVNGKGVVGDAIRRPNLVYRILTGILPF